ncbi:MAG: class I SAM-dependent methyltransferase [Burkholderiales bacterium]|nr:class I SAM-dependent methyltransferase [Burkholderiales bacterium]
MEVNVYGRALLPEQIEALAHRDLVGGLWDELGMLQFEFLKSRGLVPQHRLLDVGCGALRGGLHFIRYLDPGRYHGLDVNASLIDAGRRELVAAGLADREPQLIVDGRFDVGRFGGTFDCALAVSLFTHLPMNHIVRCLCEVRGVLAPGARFYASYFEAPDSAHLASLTHAPGGIVTFYDADPYHYSLRELSFVAGLAGMQVESLGEWNHPRDQRMLAFSVRE